MPANVGTDTNSQTKTETAYISPAGVSQYAQNTSFASESSPVYEGFTFFKADVMPNQTPTWNCVERTVMHLSQDEYFKMVQKRANKRSAAQQYENLSSDTRRAHIDRLIDERRRNKPSLVWSCVYVKEVTKPSKARNARREDYETVSMVVILMQRPKSSAYARSPMGDIVDLGNPYNPEAKHPSMWLHPLPQPPVAGQIRNNLRPMPPRLLSQMAPGKPVAGKQEPLRELSQSTATINNTPSPAFSATDSSDLDLEYPSSSCGSSSDSDDASVLFEESETSATDDSDEMETETENDTPRPNLAHLREAVSLPRREAGHRSPSSHGLPSRSLDRRSEKDYRLRERFAATRIKSPSPKRTERPRSRGSASGKRYQKQLMDDNEARSLMLDYREASIGQREKRLKRTFSEALQLDLRQSGMDQMAVCRCTCRCAMRKRE